MCFFFFALSFYSLFFFPWFLHANTNNNKKTTWYIQHHSIINLVCPSSKKYPRRFKRNYLYHPRISRVLSATASASASSTSWIMLSTIFGIIILGLGLMYWYRDVTEQSIGYIEYKINQFFDDWEFSRFWDSQTNTFRTRVVDPSDLLPF